MKKLLPFLMACAIAASGYAQPSGRVCLPFDSTFHYLKPGNLNFWLQGGVMSTLDKDHVKLYNRIAFDVHYVPVKYLQTGVNFNKKLPVADGYSFWKSYEMSLYARYTFIRMDCPKIGVYAQGGYTTAVESRKTDGGKTREGFGYGGLGLYKDLGKGFIVQVENELYFNNRPDQVSATLVWKFVNMKLRR